ncbi:MAG: 5'/3'-nucleotidase SurE [bacterium]|nr:5'/3'-nucleotidase SurE [bacterium]
MKILISNDDGVYANGINVLASVLSKDNEVYVAAPDKERSAAGHSLTLNMPLRVDSMSTFANVKKRWAISGTPSDCVKLTVAAIMEEDEKPDIIISGINHGQNLGSDILYSGTVSCAMEGAMIGIPSIAVSLASKKIEKEDFRFSAEFISSLIKKLQDKKYKFPKKTILNINIPAIPEDDIVGVKITKLGDKMFTDDYEKRVDPRGKVYYWLAGTLINDNIEAKSDFEAIKNNYISITPVTYEMTRNDAMKDLNSLLCDDNSCEWL